MELVIWLVCQRVTRLVDFKLVQNCTTMYNELH